MGAALKMFVILIVVSALFVGFTGFTNEVANQGGQAQIEKTNINILNNLTTQADDIRDKLDVAITAETDPITGTWLITQSAFQSVVLLIQLPVIFMAAAAELFGMSSLIPPFIIDHATLIGMVFIIFTIMGAFLKWRV